MHTQTGTIHIPFELLLNLHKPFIEDIKRQAAIRYYTHPAVYSKLQTSACLSHTSLYSLILS